MPVLIAGVPPRPKALPIATSRSPTRRSEEAPSVTGVRPDAPSSWISAMSCVGSAPITLAGYVWPELAIVTRIDVAPSITWLFVNTSPEEVRIMPVPAPSGLLREGAPA